MAVAFVGGAALAAVFAELHQAIRGAVETISMFRSLFGTLKDTCEGINPVLHNMERFDKILDRPQQELRQIHDLMKNGTKLVTKCSKVHRMEFYLKYYYAKKLVKLDEGMRRFFFVNVEAITARNVMAVSVDVREIRDALRIMAGGQGIITDGKAVDTGVRGGSYVKKDGPEAPSFVVGVDKQYLEVKSRLLQKGVSVTVVSGPGGCGKTTLVKKIYHDPEVKGKFKEHAYFFTASQSFDAVLTMRKMYHYQLLDAPNIQTEDDAFRALQELLTKIGRPILLVLDDVWTESKSSMSESSESLLEKLIFNNIPDYKILVTSRFEFPALGSPVRLEPLSHHSAKFVLLKAATTLSGDLRLPDDDVVDEIVRRCKGLPLALKVVGASLRGHAPYVWQSRLRRWTDEVSILDSDSEILNCLHKSLVDLSNKSVVRDCFMDLGSFPEDYIIPVCALIDMWAELRDLDGDGIHALHILHELSHRNLVNLAVSRSVEVGDIEGLEDQYVMQHDLLRQLAIHQNSREPIEQRKRLMLQIRGNTFPTWWVEQMMQPINATLLSIYTDEQFSSTWPDMDVHAVEVMVLNFCTENYRLPDFMGRMTKLKALIVANNGCLPAVLTNFALLGSLASLKRIRLEGVAVPFLYLENIQLKDLRKISLFKCDISEEVLASDIQTHDAIPNLSEVNVAYCKNLVQLPAGLCNVISLRKLSITNCPDLSELPQNIGKLLNLETLRLNSCTNLQGLPDAIVNLEKLRFLDISDCIRIEDLPSEFGRLSNLVEFHMKGCSQLSELPLSIVNMQSLRKVTCHESTGELWNPFKRYLTRLKVEDCERDTTLGWLGSKAPDFEFEDERPKHNKSLTAYDKEDLGETPLYEDMMKIMSDLTHLKVVVLPQNIAMYWLRSRTPNSEFKSVGRRHEVSSDTQGNEGLGQIALDNEICTDEDVEGDNLDHSPIPTSTANNFELSEDGTTPTNKKGDDSDQRLMTSSSNNPELTEEDALIPGNEKGDDSDHNLTPTSSTNNSEVTGEDGKSRKNEKGDDSTNSLIPTLSVNNPEPTDEDGTTRRNKNGDCSDHDLRLTLSVNDTELTEEDGVSLRNEKGKSKVIESTKLNDNSSPVKTSSKLTAGEPSLIVESSHAQDVIPVDSIHYPYSSHNANLVEHSGSEIFQRITIMPLGSERYETVQAHFLQESPCSPTPHSFPSSSSMEQNISSRSSTISFPNEQQSFHQDEAFAPPAPPMSDSNQSSDPDLILKSINQFLLHIQMSNLPDPSCILEAARQACSILHANEMSISRSAYEALKPNLAVLTAPNVPLQISAGCETFMRLEKQLEEIEEARKVQTEVEEQLGSLGESSQAAFPSHQSLKNLYSTMDRLKESMEKERAIEEKITRLKAEQVRVRGDVQQLSRELQTCKENIATEERSRIEMRDRLVCATEIVDKGKITLEGLRQALQLALDMFKED